MTTIPPSKRPPVWVLPPTTKPQQSFGQTPTKPCPDPSLPYFWTGEDWVLLTHPDGFDT